MHSARERENNKHSDGPIVCVSRTAHTRSAAVRTCFLCVFCLSVCGVGVSFGWLVGGWVGGNSDGSSPRARDVSRRGGGCRPYLLSFFLLLVGEESDGPATVFLILPCCVGCPTLLST